MKVMIFSASDATALTNAVNEFIKDKKVIDIKYSSMPVVTRYYADGTPKTVDIHVGVLIMHEEEQ